MKTTDLVILTCDFDCDGKSYGAHRVTVPTSMWNVRDTDKLLSYVREHTDQRVTADCYDKVVTPDEFRAEYGEEHWTLWGETRYATINVYWEPWAKDDSIGTIYDHTYDE